jgi:hypothetical protein
MEICVISTVKTENFEDAFEDGINKKVAKNDDVEYAAKHGIEKTCVEIRVYLKNIVSSTSTRISISIFFTQCLATSSV